jgi:ABC-type Fe3+/spermidine/putrescine transport system ATPase subunit
MTHIVLEGIEKSYGPVRALDGCSVSAERGTVLTLLGPSGCGKTTLLRTLAGFVMPDAGRVLVGGTDVTRLPPERRQVGYVFQNFALFPHLTVFGNVAYGLKVRRMPGGAVRDRVARVLDLVALSGLDHRYPLELSGGQQQRVAIARALAIEPAVLLLDEPFNALDAALRVAMQVELAKLIARLGVTAIFVTHDQLEAMALSDTVAVMRAGRIEQAGPPLAIYDRPANAYVAGFIGRANLLAEDVSAGTMARVPGLVTARADGAATLVVRPENLRLETGDGPGWPGRTTFATALGATMEIEFDIGRADPLRIALPRRADEAPPALGTLARAVVRDPAGCSVLPA